MDVYLVLLKTKHFRYFSVSRDLDYYREKASVLSIFGPATITDEAYSTMPQIHIAREIALRMGFDIDDEKHWPLGKMPTLAI